MAGRESRTDDTVPDAPPEIFGFVIGCQGQKRRSEESSDRSESSLRRLRAEKSKRGAVISALERLSQRFVQALRLYRLGEVRVHPRL